jgi:hypothetical protein
MAYLDQGEDVSVADSGQPILTLSLSVSDRLVMRGGEIRGDFHSLAFGLLRKLAMPAHALLLRVCDQTADNFEITDFVGRYDDQILAGTEIDGRSAQIGLKNQHVASALLRFFGNLNDANWQPQAGHLALGEDLSEDCDDLVRNATIDFLRLHGGGRRSADVHISIFSQKLLMKAARFAQPPFEIRDTAVRNLEGIVVGLDQADRKIRLKTHGGKFETFHLDMTKAWSRAYGALGSGEILSCRIVTFLDANQRPQEVVNDIGVGGERDDFIEPSGQLRL